jgi:NAD(P)-dependent dehydrogenase (short-subunit alcohol dehydrogenase family)
MMSLVSLLKGKGSNGFGFGSTAEEVTEGVDLSGKRYLLTGCSSGLGLETLRVLSLRGAHVIGAARSEESARRAMAAVSSNGTPVACELSEPASVRASVDAVRALGGNLDGIICNAGIMALPRLEVKYGLELQLLTNHVGHFILVTGLLDALAETGRVVMLSSSAHQTAPKGGIEFDNLDGARGYSPWKAYGQSKLANLLTAKHLAKKLEGSRKTANAVHPGVIRTNLVRHMNPLMRGTMALFGPLFFKTIPEGAATQCLVAAHPDVASVSGQYFADCNPAKPSAKAEDAGLAARLWEETEAIVAKL